MIPSVVIVGGGLIGMLTARELANSGISVTLLERGELGRESSWAGGGILSPLYPWRYPEAVTRLALWGQGHYEQLAEELTEATGIDPQWTRSGLLMLEAGDGRDAADWARRYHYAMEPLAEGELAAIEPSLAPGFSAGIWMPEVAQLRNPRMIKALRAALEQLGIRIETHCEVHGIETEGGRVRGVRSAKGRFEAERVIICGGAWSARMLDELGIRFEVEPVLGQMILFRTEPGTVTRMVLHNDRYVIPRRDGRVLTGSTLERVGFDKRTTVEALESLRTDAHRIIPALEQAEIEQQWAGLRPGTPSGIPYIGEHPKAQGLFVNAGHYRNGVVLGLASARLTADLVVGREAIVDPSPYAIRAPH